MEEYGGVRDDDLVYFTSNIEAYGKMTAILFEMESGMTRVFSEYIGHIGLRFKANWLGILAFIHKEGRNSGMYARIFQV